MFLGQRVSFHSLCAFSQHGCSSAGSNCIPPRTTADWIFCSAAQIPLNWNFKWKPSRFAADQRITWKHVMSHVKESGWPGEYWQATGALQKTLVAEHLLQKLPLCSALQRLKQNNLQGGTRGWAKKSQNLERMRHQELHPAKLKSGWYSLNQNYPNRP